MPHTPEPCDWIAWLSGQDAKLLLIALMQSVEAPDTHGYAATVIDGWRKNAHMALSTDDWHASVDGFLGVEVDARLFAFRTSTEQAVKGVTNAEDKPRA